MTDPIKPYEVLDYKLNVLPEEVIESFNIKIALHWDGKESRFNQEQVIKEIRIDLDLGDADIIDKEYLNIAEIYRKEGWIVQYENEEFIFTIGDIK